MVQTIIFYGTNVHASWYKHWCAKDFRQYPQSLWLMLPKTLAWYPKDFGMANVIPYSTIYYTIEHRTINHIARKFITDKCRYDSNQTKCMVQLQYKAWDIYRQLLKFALRVICENNVYTMLY